MVLRLRKHKKTHLGSPCLRLEAEKLKKTFMIRLDRKDNLDWIFENIDKLELRKNWKGNYVSHLLPNRFKRYIKILHTFYVDSSILDKEITWEQSKSSCNEADLEKIKWIDLAKQYNIPFTKTINPCSFYSNSSAPRYLVFPEEGSLEKFEMLELIEILSDFCLDVNCYFYYDQLVFGDFDNEHLYKGEISKLIDLYKSLPWETSPSYIWSDKKDWCLNTDYDLTFTVIGCNDALAEKLLSSEVLETIEVSTNSNVKRTTKVQISVKMDTNTTPLDATDLSELKLKSSVKIYIDTDA